MTIKLILSSMFLRSYKKYKKVFCSGRVFFFALVHRCSKRVCVGVGGLRVCKKIYVYINLRDN